MLVKLMEGVEDIPEVGAAPRACRGTGRASPNTSTRSTPRRYDVDVGAQVPHAALRVYVMGQRGADREPPTEQDIAADGASSPPRACAPARSASPPRARSATSARPASPRPTLRRRGGGAGRRSPRRMRGAGAGWLQVVSDFDDPEAEFAMLRRAGRAIRPADDVLPAAARAAAEAVARAARQGRRRERAPGCSMTGQVDGAARIGVHARLRAVAEPVHRPPELAGDRTPALRREARACCASPSSARALLAEETAEPAPPAPRSNTWDKMFPLGDPPDYEPAPEESVAARAAREGRSPEEVVYDMLLERDGHAILYRPIINYADGTLDAVRDDDGRPQHDPRPRRRRRACRHDLRRQLPDHHAHPLGPRPHARRPPAARMGGQARCPATTPSRSACTDRGVLAAGLQGRHQRDRLRPAERPRAGGALRPAGRRRRLVQRTEGYDATIVSGVRVYAPRQATGALPGRLVRGARAAQAIRTAAE